MIQGDLFPAAPVADDAPKLKPDEFIICAGCGRKIRTQHFFTHDGVAAVSSEYSADGKCWECNFKSGPRRQRRVADDAEER